MSLEIMISATARICTSRHAPPSVVWPLLMPMSEYCHSSYNGGSRTTLTRDVPCVGFVVQHHRCKGHCTKHSDVPNVLPIFLHSLLARGGRLFDGKAVF